MLTATVHAAAPSLESCSLEPMTMPQLVSVGDAQGLNTPTPQLPGLAASIKVEPAPAEQHGGAHEDNAAASGLADSQKSDANHGQQQESAPPVHALHPVGLPPLRMQTRGAVRAAAAAQRVPEHGQGSHSAPPG